MNVEEYFPEGLSVIHHDESQREGRSSHELQDTQNPAVLHCHICYKNISGPINNMDFVKPCNCQLMFVHTECAARNRKKFGEAKCSNCGQESTIQRTAKLRRSRKVEHGIGCCSDKGPLCMICNDKNHQYKPHQKDSERNLGCKIKPCFCRKVFHFGCLRPLIEEKPLCSECKVIYSGFEPATVKQFFKAKWAWFILYIVVLSLFSSLLIFAARNSLLFTTRSSNVDMIDKEIILSILAVFFLIVIIATMFSVIRYTLWISIPQFKIREGKFILNPFKALNQMKSERKSSDRESEKDFENIPLNDMREQASVDAEDPVEGARNCEADDMTLGQHMFGIYATHHSSSTPIDKPSLGFVFNSA
ncbi:hypothetical protein L5515_011215 [Caenorhabditis briggsae]|uniref:Uncharacterized protein n=1 Tax=Caenorhabditis briggsae TaxID=6238 RepID=A0AAE9EP92_CAEBR|nr:hypothetical protein L5515_011215 [Caenorhabditis briggsae]